MSQSDRSRKSYRKPQIRELGTIAVATQMMEMGSLADMDAMVMGEMMMM